VPTWSGTLRSEQLIYHAQTTVAHHIPRTFPHRRESFLLIPEVQGLKRVVRGRWRIDSQVVILRNVSVECCRGHPDLHSCRCAIRSPSKSDEGRRCWKLNVELSPNCSRNWPHTPPTYVPSLLGWFRTKTIRDGVGVMPNVVSYSRSSLLAREAEGVPFMLSSSVESIQLLSPQKHPVLNIVM
jgi:hypothetical protein